MSTDSTILLLVKTRGWYFLISILDDYMTTYKAFDRDLRVDEQQLIKMFASGRRRQNLDSTSQSIFQRRIYSLDDVGLLYVGGGSQLNGEVNTLSFRKAAYD